MTACSWHLAGEGWADDITLTERDEREVKVLGFSDGSKGVKGGWREERRDTQDECPPPAKERGEGEREGEEREVRMKSVLRDWAGPDGKHMLLIRSHKHRRAEERGRSGDDLLTPDGGMTLLLSPFSLNEPNPSDVILQPASFTVTATSRAFWVSESPKTWM